MKKYQGLIFIIMVFFLTSCDGNKESYEPFFWGDDEITVEVHSNDLDLLNVLTLHDAEDGDITITSSMIDGVVLLDVVGTYVVTYSFTDSDGNLTTFNLRVNVVDTTIPTIELIGDETVYLLQGEEYEELGVKIIDNCEVTKGVVTSGDVVDKNVIGTYQINYDYQDPSNNKAKTITRTVIVYSNEGFDFLVGDEVYLAGFYTNSPDGSYLLANFGFFLVKAVSLNGEYPIGLAEKGSDKITMWTKAEYLINRSSFTPGEKVSLAVPLLHQFDYSGNLNGSTLSISGYGCALTALTMVVNYLNDTAYTPEETNPDLVDGGLVYWVNTETEKYGNIIPAYYPSYGQYRTAVPFSNELSFLLFQMHLKEKLDEGIPPIIKIKGSTTHYVVVTGYEYNEDGEIAFKINDPGSSYRFYLSDLLGRYQYFYEGFIYYTE